MANILPPPPIGSPPGSFVWNDWYTKLQQYVGVTGVPWTAVDKTGSNLSDLVTRSHGVLQGLQGGTSGQYYHLTSAQQTIAATLAAGTYTPTLTGVANVAASTAYSAQYMRVGATVTVSGKVDIDPTSAVLTQLGISLPIASNLGSQEHCAGTASCSAVAGLSAAIVGDSTNDRAQIEWTAVDTANRSFYFTFTYRII